MKVFLDANILFSAANPESATCRLLEAFLRRAPAVTCPQAWEEARRNLEQKRPQHAAGLESLRGAVATSHAFALPAASDLPACDQPILAGAMGSLCSHLWTSDKRHFGRHYGKLLGRVKVLSSVMLADEMAGQGWEI